jgi:hypothetical protein
LSVKVSEAPTSRAGLSRRSRQSISRDEVVVNLAR